MVVVLASDTDMDSFQNCQVFQRVVHMDHVVMVWKNRLVFGLLFVEPVVAHMLADMEMMTVIVDVVKVFVACRVAAN